MRDTAVLTHVHLVLLGCSVHPEDYPTLRVVVDGKACFRLMSEVDRLNGLNEVEGTPFPI